LPGTLYIIATPIGNLEDITYRAVRILAECSAVACEDTRQTRKLLDHYSISTPLISLHEHNERERAAHLCERMETGDSIALVSDAGTPLVSDPGYRLVSEAVGRGISVVPIPGPSAALAALSAAGLPTDKFSFRGFLPPKQAARLAELRTQAESDATLIYYEAPHRILESLRDIAEVFPDRNLAVARELTKIHEEFLRGPVAAILQQLESRSSVPGEITILIGKGKIEKAPMNVEAVAEAVARHQRYGLSRMDAMKAAAREFGVAKNVVYRYLAEA
jgi:16S rRNA (cytidine1402-2'-O)-methyltransferase